MELIDSPMDRLLRGPQQRILPVKVTEVCKREESEEKGEGEDEMGENEQQIEGLISEGDKQEEEKIIIPHKVQTLGVDEPKIWVKG